MSMTDDQLNAIEARAEAYDPNDYPQPIMAYDIPALVAEVRRLRELCAECIESIEDWAVYASDYFKEKHGLDREIEGYKARLNGAESEGA